MRWRYCWGVRDEFSAEESLAAPPRKEYGSWDMPPEGTARRDEGWDDDFFFGLDGCRAGRDEPPTPSPLPDFVGRDCTGMATAVGFSESGSIGGWSYFLLSLVLFVSVFGFVFGFSDFG